MSRAQLHYLLREHVLGSAVFTFALNAALAWLTFRSMAHVPLWGALSIAGDTIATALMLPFMTCLMVTFLVRRHVRAGRVAALGWTPPARRVVGWMPRRLLARAFALGLLFGALLAPVTLFVLCAARVAPLGLGSFVVFKAAFAAGEAALVTPLIALFALAAEPAASAAMARAAS